MVNQGLYGALEQYWTLEDKPRLTRRNTYFEDHPQISNAEALRFALLISVLAIALIGFWSILGVLL